MDQVVTKFTRRVLGVIIVAIASLASDSARTIFLMDDSDESWFARRPISQHLDAVTAGVRVPSADASSGSLAGIMAVVAARTPNAGQEHRGKWLGGFMGVRLPSSRRKGNQF